MASTTSWAKKCDLEFKKLKICGTIQWTKIPHAVEMITPKDAAEMTIELSNLDQRRLELPKDLEMSVKPTMPSMGGHGTEPTRVSQSGAAKFQIHEIFLSMSGQWKFQVKLKKQDRELDQAFWIYELK